MRAATIAAAALPLGAYAVPLGLSLSIPNPICLPYNIVVNSLQTDPVLVPFCAKYINIPTTTVTSGLSKLGGAAITVTSALTVNGGGAVTVTSLTTTTVPAAAPDAVTSTVTVSVTMPTATTVASCLNSAYSAPVKSKLGRRWSFGFGGLPAPGPVAGPGPIAAPTPAAPIGLAAPSPAPPAPAALSPSVAAPSPISLAPITAPSVNVARPAYIPAAYSDAIIKIICGCVNIPTQVTAVPYASNVATTVTVVPTITIKSATSVSVTSTVTVTAAAGNAKTVTSTTTTTIGAVATNFASNGLVYKKFPSSFSGYSSNAGFSSSAFKGLTPDFSGVWSNLNFATPYWPSMSTPDTITLDQSAPFDVSQAALLFQGFFIAPQTGPYTFSVPAASNDNFAEFWTGNAALAWADSAAAFKAIRTADASSDGSTTVTMNAGDAMPITYLWANGGGAGQSAFNIVFPDGSSPTDFSKLFLQPCSSNTFSS